MSALAIKNLNCFLIYLKENYEIIKINSNSVFIDANNDIDPYKELGIPLNSNDQTIKDAYHLLKKGVSTEEQLIKKESYKLINSQLKRERFNYLRNTPLENLRQICNYRLERIKIPFTMWMELITQGL